MIVWSPIPQIFTLSYFLSYIKTNCNRIVDWKTGKIWKHTFVLLRKLDYTCSLKSCFLCVLLLKRKNWRMSHTWLQELPSILFFQTFSFEWQGKRLVWKKMAFEFWKKKTCLGDVQWLRGQEEVGRWSKKVYIFVPVQGQVCPPSRQVSLVSDLCHPGISFWL